MKKTKIMKLLLSGLVVFLCMVEPVFADDPVEICELENVTVNLVNFILATTPVIAIGVGIYGSYLWITSTGEPGKLRQAQQTLTYAIIGFVIAVSAFVTTATIESIFLGGTVKFFDNGKIFNIEFCKDEGTPGGGGGGGGKKDDLATCTDSSECKSGYCDSHFKQCMPERSRPVSYPCIFSFECASGNCESTKCK